VARVFGGTGHNETDWSRRFSEAVRFIAGA